MTRPFGLKDIRWYMEVKLLGIAAVPGSAAMMPPQTPEKLLAEENYMLLRRQITNGAAWLDSVTRVDGLLNTLLTMPWDSQHLVVARDVCVALGRERAKLLTAGGRPVLEAVAQRYADTGAQEYVSLVGVLCRNGVPAALPQHMLDNARLAGLVVHAAKMGIALLVPAPAKGPVRRGKKP